MQKACKSMRIYYITPYLPRLTIPMRSRITDHIDNEGSEA